MMKLKLIALSMVAGMAIAGCGSEQKETSNADSNLIDTSMSAQDTMMTADTTRLDTNSNIRN